MSQLSDQQEDGKEMPPAIPGTANKGYPGLVLVPPSDRTVLRRRLIRGTLLVGAGLWLVSTFTAKLPASDTTTNCQSESSPAGTEGSSENCAPAPSATQTELHPNEFSLTQVSQVESLTESSPPASSPTPAPNLLTKPPITEQAVPPQPADSPEHHITQPTEILNKGRSPISRPSEKSVSNLDLDIQLATQGDAFAQYRLGRHYAQQDGKQAPEAMSWYKKAFPGLHHLAEMGNAQAMYVLGVMYAYGRGVERDISQARRWLTRAVDQKVTAAQPVLASLPQPARPSPNLQIHAAESAKSRKQQN